MGWREWPEQQLGGREWWEFPEPRDQSHPTNVCATFLLLLIVGNA